MVRDKKAEETTSGGQIVLRTQETYLQKCDEIIQLKSSILKVRPTMFSKFLNIIYFQIKATLARHSGNSDDKVNI